MSSQRLSRAIQITYFSQLRTVMDNVQIQQVSCRQIPRVLIPLHWSRSSSSVYSTSIPCQQTAIHYRLGCRHAWSICSCGSQNFLNQFCRSPSLHLVVGPGVYGESPILYTGSTHALFGGSNSVRGCPPSDLLRLQLGLAVDKSCPRCLVLLVSQNLSSVH